MSGIYIEGYVQGKDEKSHANLSKFLNHIEKQEYSACDAFLESISDENQLEIEHYWDTVALREMDGVIHFVVEAPTFDESELVEWKIW